MCKYCDYLNGKYGWENPKEGALRVWHIPQVPMEPFHFPADSPEEAIKVLDALSQYDLFQWQHDVKPDYSNANGLEVFQEGEWQEWYDEHGRSISEIMDDLEIEDPEQ